MIKTYTKSLSSYGVLFGFMLSLIGIEASAQLPTCTGPGIIYVQSGSTINNCDPTLPPGPGNPTANTIALPAGAGGFAVGPNINGPGPSPTFYTTVGNNYWYYDGAVWVNTGHFTGNGAAVNITAGGGFIYNLVGASGDVYKYDGTGPGTLLLTVPGFTGGGPYDLCADISGNFYILRMSAPSWLRKYSPTGALLNTWNVIAPGPTSGSGPGIAIICDSIYIDSGGGDYRGWIDNSTNTITLVNGSNVNASGGDWANCPAGSGSGNASIDTGYYCGFGPGIPVSTNGTGTITWSVLSGNAVINGSGPSITVTATSGVSRILLTISGGNGICSNGTDTVTIIVPTALVNAGITPDTIKGCATYIDTLHASVNNTTPGVTYDYLWTPTIDVSTGITTLDPVVTPTANTWFTLTVSTPAAQGGCVWTDSVFRAVVDRSVSVDYNFDIDFGCDADTVTFTNLSTLAEAYTWNFADGTSDTATNPVHIYASQNTYNVKLVAENETCIDSVTKIVDTQHPLVADFTPDKDSVCQGSLISFTNTSTYTQMGGPASFFWDFGDGASDTLLNATHIYDVPGVYTVMLVVRDFVPCADTAYRTIVVDSIPTINFFVSDSVLCEGQGVEFLAEYSSSGNTSITWDFGDGNFASNVDRITHAYDTAGSYLVTLKGTYRICPDIEISKTIDITPFPSISLGPDTSMCPNGQAIVIGDTKNQNDPLAQWVWSTGETTPLIAVRHPGIYTASIMMNGCVATDSIEVFKNCYIDVPNSFTPNNDGVNDYFLPRQLLSKGVTSFKMTIYNRWGQVIFETNRIDGRGWDGKFNEKDQPTGVYVYVIDAVLREGQVEHYQGNVTLLR